VRPLARVLKLSVLLLLAAAAVGLATPGGQSALAQSQPQQPFAQRSDGWQRSLELVRQELRGVPPTTERVAQLQQNLNHIVQDAAAAEADAQAELIPLRQELDALGPPPEEGQPEERPEITEARQAIQEQVASQEARLRQAQLAQTQARALLREISRLQQQELTDRLLQKHPSPLQLKTWAAAFGEALATTERVLNAPLIWWQQAPAFSEQPSSYLLALLALAMALIVGWPLRLFLKRRFGRDPRVVDPSYTRRLLGTVVDGLADFGLPLVGLVVLTAALVDQDLLTGDFAELVTAAVRALIFFLFIAGISQAALSPHLPEWRIVPSSAEGAVHLAYRITAFAATLGFFSFAYRAVEITNAGFPGALMSVQLLISLTVNAVLLMGLLPSRFWPDTATAGAYWPVARLVVWLLLATAPTAALLGYPELGAFLLSRLIGVALLTGALLLARAILREALGQALLTDGRWYPGLSRYTGLGEQGGRMLNFWVVLAVDLFLILAFVYLVLTLVGVPTALLNLWAREALDGFEAGGLRISPLDFLLAVLVFLIALALTGLVKRAIGERLLPQTRLDIGVRQSIVAGTGYLGVIIALLLGIGAAGLDLSNVAIVAGALSVGIGFGLREVVNNFVSGLLLLIERPIKVGDWIVTAGHEGMVKRISVRATEIETFDRASVILPNSELITQPVTNWTHKNRVARIIIKVGVAYGSDTQLVHDLLMQCAHEHRDVLETPAAYVLFKNFGDSALEFELRVYARDTDYFLTVSSDLHFAIDRAFRANGVTIPFPQRDLHVVNWPKDAAPPGAGPAAGTTPSAPEAGPEGGER
jgi:small-conductance mechanosensitive channel